MVGSVPDIPGIRLTNESDNQLNGFRKEVADLLGRRSNNFPGAQPVSFARHHFQELEKRDYYLCEKTDGIRCLLYCTRGDDNEEIHYLIDRKNDYYYITSPDLPDDRRSRSHPWPIGPSGLHLPHHEDKTFRSSHFSTILDGELVLDHEKDGRVVLRYLVFDCLLLDGENLTQKAFDKRIGRYQMWIDMPFKEAYKRFPEERRHLPFDMVFKKMDKPYGLQDMFYERLPNLPHGNDGLIFTCKDTPYIMGTDEHILKWKPEHENSIDFRLKVGKFPTTVEDGEEFEEYESKPELILEVFYGSNTYGEVATLFVDDTDWEAMKYASSRDHKQLDGRIIECWLEHPPSGEPRWRFKHETDGTPRFRDDKYEPNHISTVEKVIQSIQDAVSQDELINHATDIMKAWKKRHPEEDKQKAKAHAAHAAHAAQARSSQPRAPAPPNGHM